MKTLFACLGTATGLSVADKFVDLQEAAIPLAIGTAVAGCLWLAQQRRAKTNPANPADPADQSAAADEPVSA